MRVRYIGLFISLFFATLAFSQISGKTARIDDFSSYTPANPLFFNDLARFKQQAEFDSIDVQATFPIGGRSRIYGRGKLGIFYQTVNGITRIDSAFITIEGVREEIADSLAGLTPIETTDGNTVVQAGGKFVNGPPTATITTLTQSWTITRDIVDGGETLPGWKVPYNITITEIAAYTDANTVTFNIEERGETTPNTAGTDAMASDLVADSDQQKTTSFSNANFAANTWMVPVVSAAGAVAFFSITVRYTIAY